jgi:membrane protease YdiL (CAAX protease family)
MDNRPLPPSSAEPETPATADDAKVTASPLRNALVGPDGIYALPRWLIYLAMAWIVFEVETWLLVSLEPHINAIWSQMMIEASRMVAVILPAFVMARIESRPFGDFGLPARRAFGRNFWVGTFWGIASLSVLMLALRVFGAFSFGSLALSFHGARIWKFAAYYAVFFLVTGFFEDFLMRGYSQWVLSRGVNFWPAALLLSFVFGAIHGGNPGEAKTGLVAAGLIGFFLCLTLRRTGDLWWAVGFHMAWDWGESYLYSVPDSGTMVPGHLLHSSLHGPVWLTGGTVGPEGSYLVFVVIGALWVLFDRAYPEVKYGA